MSQKNKIDWKDSLELVIFMLIPMIVVVLIFGYTLIYNISAGIFGIVLHWLYTKFLKKKSK